MQISIDIQDDIYRRLQTAGIDIQSRINEFALLLLKRDSDTKPLSFDEASKRVSEAVERYDTQSGEYLDELQYKREMERFYKTID